MKGNHFLYLKKQNKYVSSNQFVNGAKNCAQQYGADRLTGLEHFGIRLDQLCSLRSFHPFSIPASIIHHIS